MPEPAQVFSSRRARPDVGEFLVCRWNCIVEIATVRGSQKGHSGCHHASPLHTRPNDPARCKIVKQDSGYTLYRRRARMDRKLIIITRHLLAEELDIEVNLSAEEAETAFRRDPFLHQRIAGVLFQGL